MIKTIKKIISNVMHPEEYDPVCECKLYKDEGCSHVDGILCDYPQCTMLKGYLSSIHSPARELNRTEIKNYNTFIGNLPKRLKGKPVYFRFEHGSGIGISVYVKCGNHLSKMAGGIVALTQIILLMYLSKGDMTKLRAKIEDKSKQSFLLQRRRDKK